jgi:hypothetical protein
MPKLLIILAMLTVSWSAQAATQEVTMDQALAATAKYLTRSDQARAARDYREECRQLRLATTSLALQRMRNELFAGGIAEMIYTCDYLAAQPRQP